MPTTRQALLATFAGRYYMLALQFVSTIVVSHLLTPSEIGIYALSAAGVAFAHMLRDFGVGTYIIQEKELTTERIRAAQTLAYLTAWPLALLLFLSAPYAANFYGHHGVARILHWLSLNFLLLPFGTVLSACFNRQMQFNVTQSIHVAAATLGFSVTVSAAMLGASYMSMVWGSLASTLLTIGLLRFAKPDHFPSLPGFRELRRVMRVGGQVTTAQIVKETSTALPEIIIGKVQGLDIVAFFSRAVGGSQMVTRMAVDGTRPVIAPMFSKLLREDSEMGSIYVRVHAMTTAATWPALALMFIFAKPAVLLLFGNQWLAVVPLLRILTVSSAIHMTSVYAENTLNGISCVRDTTKLTISVQSLRIVAILSTVWFGIVPMLYSYLIVSFVRFAIAAWMIRRRMPLSITALMMYFAHSAIITGATLSMPLSILAALHTYPSHVSTLAMIGLCAIGVIGWTLSLSLLKHPLERELRHALTSALARLRRL